VFVIEHQSKLSGVESHREVWSLGFQHLGRKEDIRRVQEDMTPLLLLPLLV
jgi:hypothetical protein